MTEKKYKYFLNRKYKSIPGWWKKDTKLVATIYDEVNKFEWCIYLGKDLQTAIDSFARGIGVTEEWKASTVGGDGHFFAYSPIKVGAIWFEKPPLKQPGLVAHECFHAVMYLIERMSSKATEDQEEFMAYYLGFLVSQINYICKNLL